MSLTPPRVFLSYAWEDDPAYRERVEAFATRLRQNGIDARLDAWHVTGDVTIPEFMSSEVRHADKVLLVCSPKYAEKIHAMEDGKKITGSGWEHMLVTSAIWTGLKDRDAVVVVVFRGTRDDATPSFASGLPSYDLTNDDTFEAQYKDLYRRLTGQTKQPPPLGKPLTDLTPEPVPALRGASGTAPAPSHHLVPEAYTAKLPATDSTLIGRDTELAQLETAWRDGTNLVQVIAPGGTGKTALMTNWYKRHVGEARLYGWSFYKQGTGDSANVPSDVFLNHAVSWFRLQPKADTAEAKVEALVHHLRQKRTLLILDGMEPLQNQATGELNDNVCKDLLRELSVQNAGLVLCTSRIALTDLPDVPPLELENLTEADGAQYLRQKFGVQGSEEDLRAASKAYGNHALALTLLGTYLKRHGGDVSRRFEIDELPNPAGKPGDHAKRVMQSYAKQFAGQPEGEILRGLGFFDRPAEREALKLVLPEQHLDEDALMTLRETRLILSADALTPIDCHPLVREHFGALTKASDPESFRTGHSKLFDYYCQVPKKEQPDTLEELTPLFHAVAHGCHSGRHQEACEKVYHHRIRRGEEAYLTKKLGAFGTNLSLLAHFFEQPWSRPVPTLTPAYQDWVPSNAAFALRALGRLADALAPMRACAVAAHRQDWKQAARAHSNLSQLLLILGRTAEAVAAARESIDCAERSRDTYQRLTKRTTLADALHQSGDRAEVARLFAEAESLQKELQPDYPLLYSLRGYLYCDFLLAQGEHAEALRRATQTLTWATSANQFLKIGLDHLMLGRAYDPRSPKSLHHLEQAVAFLRRAGAVEFLIRALLARATAADLEEVYKIATRSGMRLHLTDYHLAMARRLRSFEHLEKAEELIQQTGYHRRDEEAATLRKELQS